MKCKKLLIIIFILIFFMIFSICMCLLLKDFKQFNENNKSTDSLIEKTIEINEGTQEKNINWDYLKSVNNDIIAWIEIEGTNINYPILKDSGTFYLKHSFDKKYNSNGSIFTTNSLPFEDDETMVYGHNMKNGSMFSNLEKFLNKEFLYKHFKFKIFTPNNNYLASIFSVYSIGIEDERDKTKALNFNEKIMYYKNVSKYQIENNENVNKIVKLSTCSYINVKARPTDQRYYIIASIKPI